MKIYNYAQLIKKVCLSIIVRTFHFHSVFSVTILGNLRFKGELLWLKFPFLYIQAACSQFSLCIMTSSPDMTIKKGGGICICSALGTHTFWFWSFLLDNATFNLPLANLFWQSPAPARACSCVPPSPLFFMTCWRGGVYIQAMSSPVVPLYLPRRDHVNHSDNTMLERLYVHKREPLPKDSPSAHAEKKDYLVLMEMHAIMHVKPI